MDCLSLWLWRRGIRVRRLRGVEGMGGGWMMEV